MFGAHMCLLVAHFPIKNYAWCKLVPTCSSFPYSYSSVSLRKNMIDANLCPRVASSFPYT